MTPPGLPAGVRFGAAHYAEYQPYDRLAQDLDLMLQADVTVIRVGESVWSTLAVPAAVSDVLSGSAHDAGEAIALGPWDVRVLAERPAA